MKIQESLEKQSFSCDEHPDMDEVVQFMQSLANELALDLWIETSNYVMSLPDSANTRPYAAGQDVLNEATAHVIRVADAMDWKKVPRFITKPGIIEPPCFLPPVSEGETRSRTMAVEAPPLTLSIVDTSQFREGEITVCFHNEGSQPVRIPDEINDKTADFFFLTVLRTERGDTRVLNAKIGTMTFQRPLSYRMLAPGQEHRVTFPVCLDEVDLEAWKQCSCEQETRYYNQQGKGCFLGALRATSRLML